MNKHIHKSITEHKQSNKLQFKRNSYIRLTSFRYGELWCLLSNLFPFMNKTTYQSINQPIKKQLQPGKVNLVSG